MTDVLYRYERATAWDSKGSLVLSLRRVPILRRTLCGAWVDDCGRERWVRLPFGKWASETIEEARWRFRKRTETCLVRRTAELARDTEYLRLAREGLWDWRPGGETDDLEEPPRGEDFMPWREGRE